jgi:hypothetical protein
MAEYKKVMMSSFDLSATGKTLKAHVSNNIMMELNQIGPPKTLKQWRKVCFPLYTFYYFLTK